MKARAAFLKKSKGCRVRGWFHAVTMHCIMLSLCSFVTVAVAGISRGMFQVVAGDRVHDAVRDSSGAFVGTSSGAARCSWLWRLLYVPREVA